MEKPRFSCRIFYKSSVDLSYFLCRDLISVLQHFPVFGTLKSKKNQETLVKKQISFETIFKFHNFTFNENFQNFRDAKVEKY